MIMILYFQLVVGNIEIVNVNLPSTCYCLYRYYNARTRIRNWLHLLLGTGESNLTKQVENCIPHSRKLDSLLKPMSGIGNKVA